MSDDATDEPVVVGPGNGEEAVQPEEDNTAMLGDAVNAEEQQHTNTEEASTDIADAAEVTADTHNHEAEEAGPAPDADAADAEAAAVNVDADYEDETGPQSEQSPVNNMHFVVDAAEERTDQDHERYGDDEAPYGRDPDGRPYTKQEYDDWVNSGAAMTDVSVGDGTAGLAAVFSEPQDEVPAVDPEAPYGREDGTGRPYTKEEYDEWLQAAGYNPEDYEDPAITAASTENLNTLGDQDGGDSGSPEVDESGPLSSAGSAGSADFSRAAALAAASKSPPPMPADMKSEPPPPPGPAPDWAKKKKKEAEEAIATTKYYIKQALEQENHALLSELVQKARTVRMPSDDEVLVKAEEVLQKLDSNAAKTELEAVTFYLKHAMELKNRDALKTAVGKAEKIPEHLRPPGTKTGKDKSDDFNELLQKAKDALLSLNKAEAETVKVYLNQGLQLRNRDVLNAAMSKTNTLPKGLIKGELIEEASKLLQRLDAEHLIHQFLQSAIKQKDTDALQAALNKAFALKMSPQRDPLLKKAQDLLLHLQKKKNKSKNRSLKAFFGGSTKSKAGKQEESKQVLFGGSLSFGIQSSSYIVPEVVYHCIEYLRKEALTQVGLFRVPGDKDAMMVLRSRFDKGEKVELTDINDTAGVLKQYLRMLPEPLVPFALYRRFIDLSLKYRADSNEMANGLKELIAQLPGDHINCLNYLVRYLAELAKHTKENKMDSNNLAIVFAPNILRPQHETPQGMLTEMPKTISIMKAIIDRADFLLPPLPESMFKDTKGAAAQ